MLASLVIVSIITRSIEADERALFFLFQAVFFPITTLLSQTRTYLVYRDVDATSVNRVLQVSSVAVAFGVLVLTASGVADYKSLAFYSLSIPLSYLAAATLAKLQHLHGSNAKLAFINILVGALRVGVVYFLISAVGASETFLLGSVLFFASSKMVEKVLGPTETPASRAVLSSGSWGETVSLFVFFIAGSVAFQWDKMYFSAVGASELLISAGVYSAFMLSPISILYATLTRADSAQIFSGGERQSRDKLFWKLATIFSAGSILYLAVFYVFWEQLRSFLFPFFEGGGTVALALGGAVVLDRLGNLRIVLANKIKLYRFYGVTKLLLVLFALTLLSSVDSVLELSTVYLLLATLSLVALIIGILLCRKIVA